MSSGEIDKRYLIKVEDYIKRLQNIGVRIYIIVAGQIVDGAMFANIGLLENSYFEVRGFNEIGVTTFQEKVGQAIYNGIS